MFLLSYENKVYSEKKPCPKCGSENVIKSGGVEPRILCRIITKTGFRDIIVWVKRLQCNHCKARFHAQAPFYKNCIYGAPIVDLCLALAANMPRIVFRKVFESFLLQRRAPLPKRSRKRADFKSSLVQKLLQVL